MNRASVSRQSVLPQRVTDNRTSLVNATPQSKDSAFGKLNIPKPQSGTSDRRTSFFGKRTSGANMPRNSTFGAFGVPEKVKDPRPLHDKSFIQQCIKHLCEFLSEQGFPGMMSVKALQSPSTKEFLKIFEFVYSLLDPTFQIPTSKTEEEIPRLLRDLGYPFALPKSSMYSVGAPHTWPQVLGALIWLIDTVKLFNNMKEQDLLFTDFPESCTEIENGADFNKLFLDYTAETYNRFMQGADTFEEEDQEYIAKLKKLYNVDEVMLESLAEKHRALSEEAEKLEKESQADRLEAKRTEKQKRQMDLEKLQSYRSEMESFKSTLENKATGISEELEATDLQVETLKQEKARLQHILLNQKFSPADIERINRERNELQQTINSLTMSLKEAQQHMWSEEIALAKVKEEAEMELAEYHNLARKLKLIPSTAQNACGRDFEIKVTSECGPSTMAQYKVQIVNPLRNMVSEVEEEIGILLNKKLSLEEAVEQVRSNIGDKMNDIKDLKQQICKLDEQLELDMQVSLSLHNMQHSDVLAPNACYLSHSLPWYHLVLQETNEQRRSVVNNLHSLFTTTADHLSIVEKFLDDLNKRMDRIYKKSLQDADTDLKELKDMVENYIIKADAS
ncbi:hypothetical protein GN956_G545 [Arapaima gigas]